MPADGSATPTTSADDEDRVDPELARQGALSFLEIPAVDPRESARFYQQVAGWKQRGDDPNEPKFVSPDGTLIGRWVRGRTVSREPGFLPFIYVGSVRSAAKLVPGCGGTVVKAPFDEGTLLVAIVRDPAGNLIGLWQDRRGAAEHDAT